MLLCALAVAGVVQLGCWMMPGLDSERPLDSLCASWDQAASKAIAPLVGEPTAIAASRLDYALFQLRRARKHCRAGWLDLAREDYDTLREEHAMRERAARR